MYFTVPYPQNEPILTYAPGSPERLALQEALRGLENECPEIPAIINGREVFSGNIGTLTQPHDHKKVLARYHKVGEKEIALALKAAADAKKTWEETPFHQRAAIFLKAAELLSKKYRFRVNAATMLGQSKSAHQAEIDSACELIDFLRFNAYYAEEIYKKQPLASAKGEWNYSEYRALEGFVFAVAPFNFTAIGGNLPTSPALMGNCVLWKPAETAIFSNYFVMKVLQEAGLPDGVINFIPGPGSVIGPMVLASDALAGVHFTGSTEVFNQIWQDVAKNINSYKSYPRLVGETGGKNFIVAHKSADIDALVTASVRGAFEYQGQKCSAAARLYLPASLWQAWKEKTKAMLETVKIGKPHDFSCFMNAVIDRKSFNRIKEYIDYAKNATDAEVVFGGNCNDAAGYFIEPTVILTTNPHFKTMEEEIFGPVLTVYLYEEDKFEEILSLCDATSPYGLTGSIFSQDRYIIELASKMLRHSAGNFYINDKPTGAVVGQQPFGGGRGSGSNEKSGSYLNLLRWVSPRSVKENFNPPTDYRYPFLQ